MRLVPVLATFFGTIAYFCAQQPYPAPAKFVQVADGLYSLTQVWHLAPFLPGMPTAVYLVRQGGSWALVDAGTRSSARQRLAEDLLDAVRATIPEGERLALFALTHGHMDHIGGLAPLLDAYPDAPVAAHAAEEDFLVGRRRYSAATTLYSRALRWVGLEGEQPAQVPATRLRLLDATSADGDLSAFGLADLRWLYTPGHTPGHISLLHTPSRTLLAGDVFSLVKPALSASQPRDARDREVAATAKPLPCLPGVTVRHSPNWICPDSCDLKQMRASLCRLADAALPYDRLLASHDAAHARGGGLTKAQVQALAASLPECQ